METFIKKPVDFIEKNADKELYQSSDFWSKLIYYSFNTLCPNATPKEYEEILEYNQSVETTHDFKREVIKALMEKKEKEGPLEWYTVNPIHNNIYGVGVFFRARSYIEAIKKFMKYSAEPGDWIDEFFNVEIEDQISDRINLAKVNIELGLPESDITERERPYINRYSNAMSLEEKKKYYEEQIVSPSEFANHVVESFEKEHLGHEPLFQKFPEIIIANQVTLC